MHMMQTKTQTLLFWVSTEGFYILIGLICDFKPSLIVCFEEVLCGIKDMSAAPCCHIIWLSSSWSAKKNIYSSIILFL